MNQMIIYSPQIVYSNNDGFVFLQIIGKKFRILRQ